MNIRTDYIISKKAQKKTSYLTLTDRIEIKEAVGYNGLFLLQYFLSVSGRPKFVLDDTKISKALKMPLRTVEKKRKALIKVNYFYKYTTTNNTGSKCIHYCILKESVYCNKYFYDLFGYNTIREVKKKLDIDNVKKALTNSQLTNDEQKDIMELLYS